MFFIHCISHFTAVRLTWNQPIFKHKLSPFENKATARKSKGSPLPPHAFADWPGPSVHGRIYNSHIHCFKAGVYIWNKKTQMLLNLIFMKIHNKDSSPGDLDSSFKEIMNSSPLPGIWQMMRINSESPEVMASLSEVMLGHSCSGDSSSTLWILNRTIHMPWNVYLVLTFVFTDNLLLKYISLSPSSFIYLQLIQSDFHLVDFLVTSRLSKPGKMNSHIFIWSI